MRNADSKRSTSRPAAMIAAALLLALPAATAFAESTTAAPQKPAAAAPAPAPSTDKAKAPATTPASVAPAPAPASAPAAVQATGPVAEPAPIVIVRTEVYGQVVSRLLKTATVLSLVSTSAEPVAVGTKALLFRKVEEPGKPPTWVEIAQVTV